MNPPGKTHRQTPKANRDAELTMQDLWLRHPEIQNAAMIEAPGIPYLRVLYVFCGYRVTQQEFDAVLNAFNRLTGYHYTQDDIAGAQIAPGDNPMNFDERMQP
jgi:hypothetical protein